METSSQWLLTALLNSCWLVAGVAAIALLCDKLLGGTAARFRHRLWVAALAASFCLPILTSFQSFFDLRLTLAEKSVIASSAPPNWPADTISSGSLPNTSMKSVQASAPITKPSSLQIGRSAAVVLVSLYLLFVMCKLGALLFAWMRTGALVRTAYFAELPAPIQDVVKRCETVFKVSRVRVHFSPAVPVPIAAGIFRPLVILPEQMLGETDAAILTSAIGHELVHVRRRDFALNLLYEFICLPLSFHPAAALIRRRIKQTRELGCDEIVAEQLMEPGVYARSLVELAGSAAPLGQTMRTISVGINDADILEERVMNMLRKSTISVRRRNLMLVAASLLFVVPCVIAAPFALHLTIAPGDTAQSGSQEEQEKKERERKEAEAKSKQNSYPRTVYSPHPEYTQDAREKKIEGTVILSVKVGTDGLVKDAKVFRSLYPSLDESAVRTVRAWRFEPQMKDGKAIAMEIKVEVSFNLYHENAEEARYRKLNQDMERLKKEREEKAKNERGKSEAEMVEREKHERDEKRLEKLRKEQRGLEERSEGGAREKQERQKKLEQDRGYAIYNGNEYESRMRDSLLEEETAKRRADLATRVKISMTQAIEAAMKEQPGTVVECVLDGEGDHVFYRVKLQIELSVSVSRQGEGTVTTQNHVIHTILIDAVNGRTLKHEQNER